MLKPAILLGLVLVLAGFISTVARAAAPVTPTSRPGEIKTQEKTETAPAKKSPAGKPVFGIKPSGKPLPVFTNSESNPTGLLYQMLALAVVILLLGGVSWYLLKRVLPRLKAGRPKGKGLEILETIYLSSRQPVYLLQVGSRRLLVSAGKEGPRFLADVTGGFGEQEAADADYAGSNSDSDSNSKRFDSVLADQQARDEKEQEG